MTAIAAPGPSGPATVGFVAGKRVGSAVQRNRAKRRMREAAARCHLKADTVYVLIADRDVVRVEFDRLVNWIRSATECESSEEMR